MSTPRKSTKSAGLKPEVVESFIPLYTKNVERMAELQKKSLDVAAEQSTEFVETCKEVFASFPGTPGLFLFDLIGQSFERVIETQKSAIDLAVQQTHSVANLAKDRSGSVAKATEGVTTLFRQGLEQSVTAKKKTLDYFGEQNKTAYETARKFGISNPFVEAFQSGVEAMIESQKTMLDIAAKPLTHVTAV